MEYPKIIQGGMGIGVSNWTLARTVSMLGQIGVVSGTALDAVLARRLQLGDIGGHIQRAFENFPYPEMARRIFDQYFIPGGKPDDQPFKANNMHHLQSAKSIEELAVLANFTEVFLAREGHDGLVGINFLEKIQAPTLPSLYGAMLAGVAFVLMGAGIPRSIPGIMDALAEGKPVKLRLDVEEALHGEEYYLTFDPAAFFGGTPLQLPRPKFFPIVSSATLAITLARKATGKVDGFIVEGATAGGHNAPPRGPMQLTEKGEPLYGERDLPDLEKIKNLGLPFWLAGSFGLPGKIKEALATGATGVQVGTAFAFCNESGIEPSLRQEVIEKSKKGEARIFTDPTASPTGFPFKVIQVDRTLSHPTTYANRKRICNLGYLRSAYRKEDGTVGFRCAAEPVENFVRKGGKAENAEGRRCLCNSLMADIGLAQLVAGGESEKALLTAGDEVATVAAFLKPGATSYTARDVIDQLLG